MTEHAHEAHTLPALLNQLKHRLVKLSLLSGFGWGAAAAAVLLGVFAWLDLALDLSPGLRVACDVTALGCGLVLLVWAGASAARRGSDLALAKRLDRVAGSNGQILAGVDLFRQHQPPPQSGYVYERQAVAAPAQAAPLTTALASLAVQRASRLAAGVRAAAVVPAHVLYRPLGTVALLAVAAGLLAMLAPRLAMTQFLRFADPYGDHPAYSPIEFKVEPGDTRIVYGSGLDVRATAQGGAVEQLELVLQPGETASSASADSADTAAHAAAAEEVLPMFPEVGGVWRASVADVTAPGRYFVRAHGIHGARSRSFTYDIITVPELKEVRFRVTPPAYTHRPPYEGPLPQQGLAGLPGTKIEVFAKSNRPLSGGEMRFTPADAVPATAPATTPTATPTTLPARAGSPATPATQPLSLAPTAPGAAEVTGSFLVTSAGKLEFNVADTAGQSSRDTFSALVSLLSDDRPFVRILEPKANSYATPEALLNISLVAEDDYGVSRVQVFRGLNESRVRPTDIPVPANQPTRLPATLPLNLADYGLEPGDTVKLYARVEDNDPAGPKGSESPVVVVHIISKEDMARMTLAREGLEVLQSKYEQARRRLEALDKEIDDLQKKLDEEQKKDPNKDPNGEVAKEMRDRIQDLANDAADAALEVAKAAAEDLPFDIDQALHKHLDEVAQDMEQAAKEADELSKKAGLSSAGAKKGLEAVRDKLKTRRQEFQQEATDPIEYLAKIFPLMEDRSRFVELYQRQRDLAERMKSLADLQAGDPKAKARMRDLEAEQRQVREDLAQLLTDIENHAAALPADPKLDELRESAKKFVEAVRKSEASDKMSAAESALAEFSGSPAAQQAQEAADILEKFIGKCNGMGEQAEGALRFQPSLSACLGDSVDQLLAAEGLSKGNGTGVGRGGGFSQRRSTLSNVGLYGRLPALSRQSQKAGGGRSTPGAVVGGGHNEREPGEPAGPNSAGRLRAAGESDAAVPPQYRRKVGDYFQRVSDELGEERK